MWFLEFIIRLKKNVYRHLALCEKEIKGFKCGIVDKINKCKLVLH